MRRQSVIRRTEIIANIIPICDSPNQCDAIPPFQFMFFFFFILNQRFHLIVLRIHAKSLLHFVIFQQHFISHSRCIISIHIIFKLYVLYIFIIRIASNFAAYIISLFQFWKWNRRDCNLVHGVTK